MATTPSICACTPPKQGLRTTRVTTVRRGVAGSTRQRTTSATLTRGSTTRVVPQVTDYPPSLRDGPFPLGGRAGLRWSWRWTAALPRLEPPRLEELGAGRAVPLVVGGGGGGGRATRAPPAGTAARRAAAARGRGPASRARARARAPHAHAARVVPPHGAAAVVAAHHLAKRDLLAAAVRGLVRVDGRVQRRVAAQPRRELARLGAALRGERRRRRRRGRRGRRGGGGGAGASSSASAATAASAAAAAALAAERRAKAREFTARLSSHAALDAAIDPHEPTYCSCQQVAFGEMVCCDNRGCPVGWYHTGCVRVGRAGAGAGAAGGASSPSGRSAAGGRAGRGGAGGASAAAAAADDKWYCPPCTKLLEAGRLKPG